MKVNSERLLRSPEFAEQDLSVLMGLEAVSEEVSLELAGTGTAGLSGPSLPVADSESRTLLMVWRGLQGNSGNMYKCTTYSAF